MDTSPTLIPPDEIDLAFVPRPVGEVTAVEIDTEILLVGPGGSPMVLNPTGALIWQCLDGEVSLGELAEELSEGLDVDAEVVRADVLDFVRQLGTSGLLEGVGIVFDFDDFPDFEQPTPLEVGEEFPPFTLPDAEGEERALDEWRGAKLLLVNWSPGCGFCTMIAPALAELAPALADEGIGLLFLTSGDVDANRAVLDDAGLDAPMLFKRDDAPDPFSGFGTPMAYLLDPDGRVAAEVGWGADRVLALAEAVAGVTLTSNPFAPPEPEPQPVDEPTVDADLPPENVRYLPPPGGA